MLRGVRLALLCLVAIAAAPAQANDGGHAVGATQVHQRRALNQPRAPGLWALEVKRSIGPLGLRSRCGSATGGSLGRSPRVKQGRSGMAVALTERLRVGLGYRHLEGEDLWPEFADTGATDYDSHHLLLRASWRF